MSPDDNPVEAGLSFAVDWNKPDFKGKESLMKIRGATRKRRLIQFVLIDPEPVLWGNEPIFRDGQIVGYTSSGAYGYTLGASVGLGYVSDPEGEYSGKWASGAYEIESDGIRYAATPHLRPAYDPGRLRSLS